MKLTVTVRLEGEFGKYVACKDVPDYQRRCFAPLKTSDDALLALVCGEVVKDSYEELAVVRTRKRTAEDLARELAVYITEAMKKNDTHNGYGI